MADNSYTTLANTSAIGYFAAQRAALLQAADEGNRDLTPAEADRFAVWGEAIAYLPARTAGDAAAQIEVMRERMELVQDGVGGLAEIAQAWAALRSARHWLRPATRKPHAARATG